MKHLPYSILALLVLAGCGGGGSGSIVGTQYPQVTINWPAQTRAVNAPEDVNHATIWLIFGNAAQGSEGYLKWEADRPSGSGAQSVTYTGPSRTNHAGTANLIVHFSYGPEGGPNSQLSSATIPVNVTDSGDIRAADGTDLGTITPSPANLTNVSVVPSTTDLHKGESTTFTTMGTVTDGETTSYAALDPRYVDYSLVSGQSLATLSGSTLTATGSGAVKVKVTYRGVSGTTNVSTWPALVPTTKLTVSATGLVWDSSRNTFWATFGPTGSPFANCLATIDPVTGTVNPVMVINNAYALALSSDNTTAYVGTSNSLLIRKIDLATRTIGATYTLPNPTGNSTLVAALAVNPNNANEFLAKGNYLLDALNMGRDGVWVAQGGSVGDVTSLSYADSSHAVSFNQYPPAVISFLSLGANSISTTDSVNNFQNAYDIAVGDGRVFTAGGNSYSSSSGAAVGTYTSPTASPTDQYRNGTYFFTVGFARTATDPVHHISWQLNAYFGSPTPVVLDGYDANTLSNMGSVCPDIPGGTPSEGATPAVYGPSAMIRYGDKGLAFKYSDAIYLLPTAPGF